MINPENSAIHIILIGDNHFLFVVGKRVQASLFVGGDGKDAYCAYDGKRWGTASYPLTVEGVIVAIQNEFDVNVSD